MSESARTFFNRHGQRLAAVLALPDGAGPHPGVLLCQGLSGVKHLVLPEVAAGLTAAGIASLRFDYAGCGQSDGDPGWIDPAARVEDARFGFAFLAAQDDIDIRRMGIYGHSYGGPVAITVAAAERRARAVVSVSGPGDGATMLRALRPSWDQAELTRRVEEERGRIATTGVTTDVDVTEILPFSPAFLAAYERLKAEGGSSAMPAAPPRYRLASIDLMTDLHPQDAARRLGACALLMVHGAEDDVAPPGTVESVYAAAPGPKRWVTIPGAGHNDLDAGPGLERAIDLAVAWFGDRLADD